MTRHRWILAGLFLLASAAPLSAQIYDWQHRWYWGAKAGGLVYNLPSSGNVAVAQFGGDWLITAKRTALYVGFSTSLTQERDNFDFSVFSNSSGTYPVAFDGMRRIQIAVVVLPFNGALQPYAGAGFVIETLTNAGVDTTLANATLQASLQSAVQEAASGGFALVVAGAQLRLGRSLALYGHYQVSPQGRDFLLRQSSHSLEGGIRLNLLPSREDDVTTRR